MKDVILIVVILLLIGYAALYIHRSKKKGRKCIGCPSGGNCAGNCQSCSYCGDEDTKRKP